MKAQALARTDASVAVVDRAFRDAVTALAPFGRRLTVRAHHAHFEALARRGDFKKAVAQGRRALELADPAAV